ncbi:uncharacterized protein E0L32_006273 [Thyridium curvatum]|uniref:Uncharacterized protein n=1 Tax=Thyridium curvatum TaxID=1093900 RepID=A0A507B9M6_9PEZI|nr:uncharacterized protein E0L32_006273 [Thyridium curvatum]TPX13300.1 hypothetical protein E0L32_006273 [Thyridium curvatum]
MTSPVEYVASALSITASAIKTVRGVYEFLGRVRQVGTEIESLHTTVEAWTKILETINGSLELRKRSRELVPLEVEYLDHMGRVISMCEKDVKLLQKNLPQPVESTSMWRIRGRDSSWRQKAIATLKMYIKEDQRLIARIARHMQLLSDLNFICPGSLAGESFLAQNRDRLGRLPQMFSENDTHPSSRAASPSTRTQDEMEEEKVITEFEDATFEYTTYLVIKGHDFTPPIEPTMEEIQIQFEANQAIVGYLFDSLKLPGNAYRLHKRGIEIRKTMDEKYGIKLDFDTHVQLDLRLIEILKDCKTSECSNEAYKILRAMDEKSWGDQRPQRFEIRFSLAEVCGERQEISEACRLLRTLYTEYKKEPRSYRTKLQQVVQLIDQGYRGSGNLESSYAWRVMVERDLGVDFFPSHILSQALDWCRTHGFDVSEVQRGVPVDQIRNHEGDSPLHYAARNPDTDIDILEGLLSKTHSLDGRDRRGNTVLMIAAEGSGDLAIKVMGILLARSTAADLIARGGVDDETPLHRCRDPEIARLLLQRAMRRGSCVSTNSVAGSISDNNALNDILNNQHGCYRKTPLHTACQYARTDVVKILLAYGADPSLLDAGKQIPRERLPPSTNGRDRFLITKWMLSAYIMAGKSESDKKKLLSDHYLRNADRKALLSKQSQILTLDATPSLRNVSSIGTSSRRSSATTAITSSSSHSDQKSSTEAPRLSIAIESPDMQFRFH